MNNDFTCVVYITYVPDQMDFLNMNLESKTNRY